MFGNGFRRASTSTFNVPNYMFCVCLEIKCATRVNVKPWQSEGHSVVAYKGQVGVAVRRQHKDHFVLKLGSESALQKVQARCVFDSLDFTVPATDAGGIS